MNAVVADVPREVVAMPMQEVTPAQMLAIAVQQGADLQKLEKLMDLQERWEANRARKAFDAAISAAKAEIKPVTKNRKVDFTNREGKRTNYEYEDFAAVAREVDPVLAKHGLSYRYRTLQEGKTLSVTCVISHRDGHSESTTLTAANDESGNKNSIQAIGSTAVYLQRYTLKLALGIAAAKDDDGNGASNKPEETLSKEQIAAIEKLMTEVGADKPKFLKYIKVGELSEVLARNYDAVVKLLEQKRSQQ